MVLGQLWLFLSKIKKMKNAASCKFFAEHTVRPFLIFNERSSATVEQLTV